ncbi:hypothetical protein NQ317_012275 [Molorchus minor]|uniref:WD repeat-containing protein 89 n=1 Tax=Molorchus minor TaxID=1323400 RepID=A0ABQ9K1U2_9CUCU|nr:hypothetical protein NQ317_012275 [Molorchus minor]
MISETLLKMHELELDIDNQEDFADSDTDTCSPDEITRLFTNSNNVANCEKIIAKNKYILHIAATSENQPNIAIGLSDNTYEVFTLSDNQVTHLSSLTGHKDKIIDCRFHSTNSNLLYTGSSDGCVKLWDLRAPQKSSQTFLDTTVKNGEKAKGFNCFDISSNERLLTVGTDLFEGDAYLLFWDTRSSEILGGYWESHTDDITQVKFHPSDRDKLISGSTDGLINIYDLSQTCEDDALIDTLNTDSSIEQLLWFNEDGKDHISCITHTSDLQLWDVDGAAPYKHFNRTNISQEIKKKSESYVYIANCHATDKYLMVLAGSNFNNGECLRSFYIENGKTQQGANFEENKQRVRCSYYNANINVLLTGGEKGILNVWKMTNPSYSGSVKKKK